MTPRRGPPFRDRVRGGVIELKCRKCGDWLWIEEFVRSQSGAKHGRLYTCKVCFNARRNVRRKIGRAHV